MKVAPHMTKMLVSFLKGTGHPLQHPEVVCVRDMVLIQVGQARRLCLGKVWSDRNLGVMLWHSATVGCFLFTKHCASCQLWHLSHLYSGSVDALCSLLWCTVAHHPMLQAREKMPIVKRYQGLILYEKKKGRKKKTSEQTFNRWRKRLNRLKLSCLQRVFKSSLQTLLFQSLCSFIYKKLNTG